MWVEAEKTNSVVNEEIVMADTKGGERRGGGELRTYGGLNVLRIHTWYFQIREAENTIPEMRKISKSVVKAGERSSRYRSRGGTRACVRPSQAPWTRIPGTSRDPRAPCPAYSGTRRSQRTHRGELIVRKIHSP